jgi:hypothetical protein
LPAANASTNQTSSPVRGNRTDAAVSSGVVNAMPGAGRVDFTGSGNTLSISGASYTLVSSAAALQAVGSSGDYALAGDIDAGSLGNFTPIGGSSGGFNGVLEGLGHVISNLTINETDGPDAGLVGTIEQGSVVADLGVTGIKVSSTYTGQNILSAGGIAGENYGLVRNAFSSGAITTLSDPGVTLGGGLVGENSSSGAIQNAYSTVSVNVSGYGYAGGLVGGVLGGSIENAYATGAVVLGSGLGAGGLIGSLDGSAQNVYATGAIGGSGTRGGLIGSMDGGSLVNAYWDVQTSGVSTSAGGTGLTTAQLQAALPSGFSASDWGIVAGKSFPYLVGQFAPAATPQVISGTVYTDNGNTPAGAGVSVGGFIDGNALAAQQTGSNGYYYFLLAGNTLGSGADVLVYAHNYGPGNSLNGATFLDGYSGSGTPNLAIDGDVFSIQTHSGTLSGVLADLAVAEGNGATAATALGNIGAVPNISIAASSDFTVDNNELDENDVALNVQGNLTLAAPILALDALQLVATGNISQSGSSLNVLGATSINAYSVSLTGNDNQFAGPVTLVAHDALLDAAGALTLGNSNILATLSLNSTGALNLGQGNVGSLDATSGGAVTQSGALTAAQATIAAGSNAITLDNANNAFSGEVSLSNSGADDVVFNNGGNALVLGDVAVGSGALTLSGGGISQTGSITQAANAGPASFDAGNNAITLAGSANDLTGMVALTGGVVTLVNGAHPLLLGNVMAGTLDLQAGNIAQSSGTALGVATLTGSSTGSVTLANTGNVVTTLNGFTSNGSFSLYDSADLTQSATLSSSGNPLTLQTTGDLTLDGTLTATGSTAQLIAGGGVSCESGCSLTAATLTGSAGIATLSGGDGTIHITTLDSFNSVDLILDDNASSLTLSGSLTGNDILSISDTGKIIDAATIEGAQVTLRAPQGIAIDGNLNASDSLILMSTGASSAITQTAPIEVSGDADINASTITLTHADNVVDGRIFAAGTNLQLATSGAMTIQTNVAGTATVTSGGALDLNGILATTFNATSGGPVTQDAAFNHVTQVSINAGDNPITLDNAANDVTGTVSLSNSGANDVVFSNGGNALTLGTIAVGSGTLALSGAGIAQAGSITQAAGAGQASFNGGAGAITLASSANDLTGTVALAGSGVTLVNGTNPLVLGEVELGSGTLGISASVITQADGTTITAGSLTGLADETLTLNNANAVASLGLFEAGSFAFHDATALTVDGAITGLNGNVLISSAGNLTLDSPATVSGANVILASGGAFANNASAAGNALDASGTWQVWSQRSEADNLDGLAFDFKQYGATYGSSAALGTGNGVFYTEAPAMTVSLSNSATVSKTYDGSNGAQVNGYALAFSGVIGQDILNFNPDAPLAASYDNANAGTHKQVTVSGWNLSFSTWNGAALVPVYGYQVNSVASNSVGTITPAPLTITANPASKIYDGLAYAGGNGVSYSGFVNGETAAVLSGALSYGGNAQGAIDAGDYAILPGGLTAGNYAITFAPGQLSGLRKPLTVTANDASKGYDGLAYIGGNGASYSGFVNGETAAVLSGALSYGGDAQGATNVGTYTLLPGGLASANYTITYVAGQLSVTPAPLTITANDASKVYDGLAYAGSNGVSYSGLVNGETPAVLGGALSYGGDAQGATNAGTYAIVPGGLSAANYAILYVPGSLTVTPAPLSVSVDAVSKTYDARAYAGGAGVSYAGFVDGQDASVLGGVLVYGGDAQGAVDTGRYTLAAGGLASGNYAISYTPGTLTITPAVLTYVASPEHLYSGAPPQGLTGTVAGFLGGDTLANSTTGTLGWSTPANAQSPAGEYAILGSGLSARNYVFAEAPADADALTIGVNSLPAGLDNATAALQQQLGLMAPYAMADTTGAMLRPAATASATATEASGHVAWPHAAAPYAPDLRIVGSGMRLP